MRELRLFILIVFVFTVIGCSGQNASSQPEKTKPPVRTEKAGVPLPPPGKPLVGKKPPMPATEVITDPAYRVEAIATGLIVPWDIAFVSKDRAYVTERPGRVRILEGGKLRAKPYAIIPVSAEGEGGLLGIALHPMYPDPRWVYLMYTYKNDNRTFNRVSRFTDTGDGLKDEVVVVEGINGALFHNGGALRFGPDGMLYVGTGDARVPESAQDKSSLNGKILRMTPEGNIPPDNPFGNSMVYAYGLRNVQGLAWNPENNDLWATMHGPTGEFGLHAMDSVFIVAKGDNCGWPRSLGVTDVRGVTPPVLFYPGSSVPPGLCTFYTGSLMPKLNGNFFFASLAGEHLQRIVLSGPKKIIKIQRWFETGTHKGKYGRLRAVVQGPDGALYITTSDQDRRGSVHKGDDKILKISP